MSKKNTPTDGLTVTINNMGKAVTDIQRNAFMLGVEFGYRQGELGLNIQAALEKAKRIYDGRKQP